MTHCAPSFRLQQVRSHERSDSPSHDRKNNAISLEHSRQFYSPWQRINSTWLMNNSYTHETLNQRMHESRCLPEADERSSALICRERVCDATITRNGHQREIKSKANATLFNGNSKAATYRGAYCSCANRQLNNCRQQHSFRCRQNSHVTTTGDYVSSNLPPNGSFAHTQQHNITAQFLPFAYYNPPHDIISSCSSMAAHSNKNIPLDYSRSSQLAAHEFVEGTTKPGMELQSQNLFSEYADLPHM